MVLVASEAIDFGINLVMTRLVGVYMGKIYFDPFIKIVHHTVSDKSIFVYNDFNLTRKLIKSFSCSAYCYSPSSCKGFCLLT